MSLDITLRDEDGDEDLQEKYPLKYPAYWSTIIGAPTIKLRKKAAGTVVDWYLYSVGSPFEQEGWRTIVCHPPKRKAHMVAECPFDEIANLMYHLYLVGAWDD